VVFYCQSLSLRYDSLSRGQGHGQAMPSYPLQHADDQTQQLEAVVSKYRLLPQKLPIQSVCILGCPGCETDLLGDNPLSSGWTVRTVIRFDHVEHIIRRVGDEFPRSIREWDRILLQFLTKLWYSEDPIISAEICVSWGAD
jgi:hypothetical protein